MVVTESYKFKDGRDGFLSKSDRIFTVIEEKVFEEVAGEIIERNEPKIVFYDIRKKGTNEIYNSAIDMFKTEYEEVAEEEMQKKYNIK